MWYCNLVRNEAMDWLPASIIHHSLPSPLTKQEVSFLYEDVPKEISDHES
jgi:hypothetical protein